MAEPHAKNSLPHAVFSFFVWQTDFTREITPAEADAFFTALEKSGASSFAAAETQEIQHAYAKLWRDYIKSGPPSPLELSLVAGAINETTRAALLQLVSALDSAAPKSKRKKNENVSRLLKSLLAREESALIELQKHFQESRFYTERLHRPVSEAAPVENLTISKPVAVVETVVQKIEPTNTAAEPVTVSEKSFTTTQPNISVLKLVPWSEHDAVNPERLQFWTKGSRAMRCIGIIDRSSDFKSFQFMAEHPTLFFYKPGQFVTLELMIGEKRVLRSYTISSSPSRPHLIEISVKRVKGGLVSNYLHEHLQIGDTISMKPPAGKFHSFDSPSDKYLFLAAGSGITPMLSMARWWHDTGAHPDVVFFHSVREPEDAVFAEDMITFTSANRNFRYQTAFTSSALPASWPGMKGRFDEEKLLALAPDFQERMIFTCGPDSFMKKVRLVLEQHKFPMSDRFRLETFGSPSAAKDEAKKTETPVAPKVETKPTAAPLVRPAKVPLAADAVAPVVHFSLSSMEIFGGDMDVPILELAEEVGVEIPSSCRAGTCGTCRAMKIKGEIECDDAPGLSEADREAGYILTCVSRAKNYVEIEV